MARRAFLLAIVFGALFGVSLGHAQEFSSSNFRVLDPVLMPAGYSTSTSFSLTATINQMSIGTSSITNFGLRSGFLYFPFVSTPVVSATAGSGSVDLAWTSASGALGWTVSSYSTGYSTASGGPYTYTNVGNTTSATVSSLTNGTTYYFVIRVKDSFGNFIATSSQVSATPASASPPPTPPTPSPSPSPSGGGPFGPPASNTGAVFDGRAYPSTQVTLLKDGQIAAKTVAGGDAKFEISLMGLDPGAYNFSIYGEDRYGSRSALFTFPVTVTQGTVVHIGGIFLAPTIDVDKPQVKKGETVRLFGQGASEADIVISIHSDEELFAQAKTDKDGIYFYNLDTSILELGQHSGKAKAMKSGEISNYGKSVGFLVGDKTVTTASKKCGKGDLNCDGRVNLVDFSIAAFWYKRTLSLTFKEIEKSSLNADGLVNLVDFSIMAYYWTG